MREKAHEKIGNRSLRGALRRILHYRRKEKKTILEKEPPVAKETPAKERILFPTFTALRAKKDLNLKGRGKGL